MIYSKLSNKHMLNYIPLWNVLISAHKNDYYNFIYMHVPAFGIVRLFRLIFFYIFYTDYKLCLNILSWLLNTHRTVCFDVIYLLFKLNENSKNELIGTE
jgi:hypothetical protein